jgi:hypothetical protein
LQVRRLSLSLGKTFLFSGIVGRRVSASEFLGDYPGREEQVRQNAIPHGNEVPPRGHSHLTTSDAFVSKQIHEECLCRKTFSFVLIFVFE